MHANRTPPRYTKSVYLFSLLTALGGVGVLIADAKEATILMWVSFALVIAGGVGVTVSIIRQTTRFLNSLSRRD